MSPRKLWEISPHLSGPLGWRRLLLQMKAYCDESGKGQHPMFVMAGFIARAEDWAKFDEDWQAQVLDMEPRIEAFHMTDAVAVGDFERIKAAGKVIGDHKLQALSVLIETLAYDFLAKGKIGRDFDNPYFPACLIIMERAIEWEIEHGIDEAIDFVFDEQMFESDRLKSIWSKFLAGIPGEFRRRFGQRPIHLNDVTHPGLQAADMLAWTTRRLAYCREIGLSPDTFLRGLFNGISVAVSPWDAHAIANLMARVKRTNERLGQLTHYEMAAESERRDILFSTYNREAMTAASPGDVVPLVSIPAKGIGRFLLVHSCPHSGNPHLHRRSGDECLAEMAD